MMESIKNELNTNSHDSLDHILWEDYSYRYHQHRVEPQDVLAKEKVDTTLRDHSVADKESILTKFFESVRVSLY